MAVRRDAPQDVQWRAGHTTSDMTAKYIAIGARRLRLGPILDTLAGRIMLAEKQATPMQEFLLLVLSDEINRRPRRRRRARHILWTLSVVQ